MKIKSWYKTILVCLFTVCMVIASNAISAPAANEYCPHGYHTFNDQQLTGGVGQYGNYRRYYCRRANVDAYWSNYVSFSFDCWVNTSTPEVTTSIFLDLLVYGVMQV